MLIEESTFYTRPGWAMCFNIYPDDMTDAMEFHNEDLPAEVRDWLEEHIDEQDYAYSVFDIEFRNKEDATLFLLRFS
jgi:hemerythrin